MNKELEAKLIKKYPKVFKNIYGDLKQTCMAWGCDHEDGWYKILDALFSCLRNNDWFTTSNKDSKEPAFIKYYRPTIVAAQIKEKYGRLVVYYDIGFTKVLEKQIKKYPKTMEKVLDEFYGYVDGAIRMASAMSENTCEICGNPASLCTTSGDYRGWHKTLCPVCATKNNYKKLKK